MFVAVLAAVLSGLGAEALADWVARRVSSDVRERAEPVVGRVRGRHEEA